MFQTLRSKFSKLKTCLTPPNVGIAQISTPIVREYVVFDGDNATVKAFQALYQQLFSHVEYKWVHRGTVIPNSIKQASHTQVVTPPHSGKEAVDLYIAMDIINKCHLNPHVRKVYVVSNDGDFVDVIYNASVMFPKVQFTQLVNKSAKSPASRSQSKSLRLLKRTPTPNMTIVNFKPKEKI